MTKGRSGSLLLSDVLWVRIFTCLLLARMKSGKYVGQLVYLLVCLFVCLFLFVCLYVYLFVCLCVCVLAPPDHEGMDINNFC